MGRKYPFEMAYVGDIYMPVHFSIFREKGLSGNDALLYALLCFLAKGGTATRTVAWLAGELNVSQLTIRRSLETLADKKMAVYQFVNTKKKEVRFFIPELKSEAQFFLPSGGQNDSKCVKMTQNVVPHTPLSEKKENIKENIIKENKKERFSKNEEGMDLCSQLEKKKNVLQEEVTEEEKAKIREHQLNIERKLHLIEQDTRDPGGLKKKARAAAEEAAHKTPSVPLLRGKKGGEGETPEQRAMRLLKEAYERGRALRDVYTDKDSFDAALAQSFHQESDPRLNEMLRRECKRGWEDRPLPTSPA